MRTAKQIAAQMLWDREVFNVVPLVMPVPGRGLQLSDVRARTYCLLCGAGGLGEIGADHTYTERR